MEVQSERGNGKGKVHGDRTRLKRREQPIEPSDSSPGNQLKFKEKTRRSS
jgi:hypothetical protein